MRTVLAVVLFSLVTTLPLAAQEAEKASEATIRVSEAVVATGVEDREPVGAGQAFAADVGKLYFYTIFEGDFGEAQVEHVWLRDGDEVARVPLTIRGPRWRTWSSKTIPSDWTGRWVVQVVDSAGEVLGSAEFVVGT